MRLLAFAVAVAYYPSIFAAAWLPRWAVIAMGLPIFSSLNPRNLYSPVAICLLLGLCWAAASLWITPHPHAGALEFYYLSLICLALVAAAGLDDLDPVLTALSYGVGISSLLCLPQTLGWSPVAQESVPAGLFFNSEVLAEVAAPLCIWSLGTKRWAILGLMLIPVALDHSRIAVLVVAIGLLTLYRDRRLWVASAALLPIVAFALIFTAGFAKFESAYYRVGLWMTALWSITPFGRGIGWWEAAHPHPIQMFVHSDVLQMFVELGIGALFFCAIPIIILWRGGGHAALRAAYIGVCVECFISFPLHFPANGFLAALLAGFLARARATVLLPEFPGGVDLRQRLRRESSSSAVLP